MADYRRHPGCKGGKDLKAHGTYQAAKKAGLVRLEGKEYVVADGDIINFRFNI